MGEKQVQVVEFVKNAQPKQKYVDEYQSVDSAVNLRFASPYSVTPLTPVEMESAFLVSRFFSGTFSGLEGFLEALDFVAALALPFAVAFFFFSGFSGIVS